MFRIIILIVTAAFAGSNSILKAQTNYWQQKAEYKMNVTLNVSNHYFIGDQQLTYSNNSPDTLRQVFYHLYFNAFQPGSMMDVRSRNIEDPDSRVTDRISKLKPEEIGYLRVKSFKQDGVSANYKVEGTILEVKLQKPILPGKKALFSMNFEGQVPVQIRRSGRDNQEGIAYSMVQWYPKMAEYDPQGWHANPYIGREFYGVWGNFDVRITLDAKYTVAATGYLQNPESIGHGYHSNPKPDIKNGMLTWHYTAPDVHDFAWAADPDYKHETLQMQNGTTLHFFYQPDSITNINWPKLMPITERLFNYLDQTFGPYPYRQFSVIQGGDGGMEYPMSTLILGRGSMSGLVGVTIHEAVHSWFYGVLGNNESLYHWMDEGFTSFASSLAQKALFDPNGAWNPHANSYATYFNTVKNGKEEAMSTHSDHFKTNQAYGTAAYSKGAVLVNQLGYIIGQEKLMQGFKIYYDTWKFRHPKPTDFMRIFEKISGIELDWYFEYFVSTTKTIDYGIKTVISQDTKTLITLERIGEMPMPIDLVVSYNNGTREILNIPLNIMRGEKSENQPFKWTLLEDWPWTSPTYALTLPVKTSDIKQIEIDPSQRMADINRENNLIDLSAEISIGIDK